MRMWILGGEMISAFKLMCVPAGGLPSLRYDAANLDAGW